MAVGMGVLSVQISPRHGMGARGVAEDTPGDD